MLKWRGWSPKALFKELLSWVVVIAILSNVMSYLRKPTLQSDQLPPIAVTLIDGTPFESQQLEGRPLVLHFWGSWCPTCRMEAVVIESISHDYPLLSIAVNSGSDSEIATYMQEHELSFKVLNDREGSWAKRFDVQAFPTTFVYDGRGKLRFSEVGYTTTAGLLARLKLIE